MKEIMSIKSIKKNLNRMIEQKKETGTMDEMSIDMIESILYHFRKLNNKCNAAYRKGKMDGLNSKEN